MYCLQFKAYGRPSNKKYSISLYLKTHPNELSDGNKS